MDQYYVMGALHKPTEVNDKTQTPKPVGSKIEKILNAYPPCNFSPLTQPSEKAFVTGKIS